jgi:hypothetical protein
VAELGLVGSVPVFWWCVVVALLLFRRRGTLSDRLAFGLLRGVLLGFAVASMFGMPAQSAAVAVTFWAFLFWLALERADDTAVPHTTWTRPMALAAGAVIALHLAATAVDARGDLRPRHRAERFGWFYRYGIGELEPDPGGNPLQRRWTGQEALVVIPVNGKLLKFVAWIDHPDGDERPVKTRVWADGKLVFDGEIRRSQPLFLDIPATPGRTHMILETEIDRLWAPRDYGMSDRRGLGLSIRDWVWE